MLSLIMLTEPQPHQSHTRNEGAENIGALEGRVAQGGVSEQLQGGQDLLGPAGMSSDSRWPLFDRPWMSSVPSCSFTLLVDSYINENVQVLSIKLIVILPMLT